MVTRMKVNLPLLCKYTEACLGFTTTQWLISCPRGGRFLAQWVDWGERLYSNVKDRLEDITTQIIGSNEAVFGGVYGFYLSLILHFMHK